MKILHVIPLYLNVSDVETFSTLGGGERYPFELARFLARNNPDDDVQIMLFGNSNKRIKIDGIRINIVKGIKIFSFVNGNISPLPFSLNFIKLISQQDIIHGFHIHSDTTTLVSLIANIFKKPIILTDFGGGGRLSISRIVSRLLKVEKLASCIFCISKFDSYFWNVKNKEVIYGGVDIKKYSYQKEKKKYVLYVGRMLPHKGIDVLINSLPKKLKLIIAGRVSNLKYLNYLKQISSRKRVIFIENPSDKKLINLYKNASCFVLPSTHDGQGGKNYRKTELFGLAVIEAMACGTPVIVSDAGSLPELIKNGFNGYIVKDRDVENLSMKIAKITYDKKQIAEMGLRGRQIVERKYNWEIIARKVRNLYESYKI